MALRPVVASPIHTWRVFLRSCIGEEV